MARSRIAVIVFASLLGCSSGSSSTNPPVVEADSGEDSATDGKTLGDVGAPCAAPDACKGEDTADCLADWPEGYCSRTTCETGTCPEGSECFLFKDGRRACLKTCAEKSDCRAGYACADTSACVPACTADSCGAGKTCDAASGRCVRDEDGPPTGPMRSCDGMPTRDCTGTATECGTLSLFEPVLGPGYENYPLNGETATNQYRSFLRLDAQMLTKWAAALVLCRSKDWKTNGKGALLALGDMSEKDGSIPGTSIGSPGHPAGTHVNGYDMDIGYLQIGTADNRLRPICKHTDPAGADAYHCTEPPDHLDLWRTTLTIGTMLTSDRIRVIGCDGKVGPLVLAAMPVLCNEGWLPAKSCSSVKTKLAFEETDTGRGWFQFHHHHFHISLKPLSGASPASGFSAGLSPDGASSRDFFERAIRSHMLGEAFVAP